MGSGDLNRRKTVRACGLAPARPVRAASSRVQIPGRSARRLSSSRPRYHSALLDVCSLQERAEGDCVFSERCSRLRRCAPLPCESPLSRFALCRAAYGRRGGCASTRRQEQTDVRIGLLLLVRTLAVADRPEGATPEAWPPRGMSATPGTPPPTCHTENEDAQIEP